MTPALLLLLGVGWGKKPDLGDPSKDRCDHELLETMDRSDPSVITRRIRIACPGLPDLVKQGLEAHGAGELTDLAGEICPRARGDLRRDLSPGFEARLLGVGKSCKVTGLDPAASTGPQALILGHHLAERLRDAGAPEALALGVGRAVAGIDGGRGAGRYGSFALVADGLALPTARRAREPLPVGDVTTLAGGRQGGSGPVVLLADAGGSATGLADLVDQVADLDGGAWIAVMDGRGTFEHAPVSGFQVWGAARPASVRVVVSADAVRVELGTAGAVLDGPLEAAVITAREQLSVAQEYGGDTVPPDRVWVMPEDGVTVQQVVAVLDALLTEDGSPRFAEVVLAREATVVDWPERVDGTAL